MKRFGFTIRTQARAARRKHPDHGGIARATPSAGCGRCTLHCEIIECRENAVPRRVDQLDVENIIGLISGMPTSFQRTKPPAASSTASAS